MIDHARSVREGNFTVAQHFLKLAQIAESDEALFSLMGAAYHELVFR